MNNANAITNARIQLQQQRSLFRLSFLFLVFFVVSLLTNIIGPLVPDIIKSFELSLTMAAFLPFSFFVAYAFMSIPSGMMIERWGEKPVLVGAFVLALSGSLLFCVVPQYSTAIISLFLIGLGMAALQVAINPLLRVTGGEEHFAFNASLAQLVFGVASFLSPLVYSHFATGFRAVAGERDFATSLLARVVPPELPWTSMYWIFSLVTIVMIALVAFVRFPRFDKNEDEKAGAISTHIELLRQPVVWLFFAGIFAYVGIEQGLSNWMSEFLSRQHGFNPQVEGANAVSKFWLFMTVGCGLGLVLLKFFDSKKVLFGFSTFAVVTMSFAIFGSSGIAPAAFAITGFAISVMWSIVFSLALNSLPKNHGTFSGILCTGIVGGAVLPLIIGSIGDRAGLRVGLCVLYLPLAYIWSMSLWAKPLVQNKTVEWGTDAKIDVDFPKEA